MRKTKAACYTAGALAALHILGPAHGDTIVQEMGFDFPLSPGGTTLVFDQFDDQGGTLTLHQVTLEVDALIGADITLENLSKLKLNNPSVTADANLEVQFAFLDFSIGYDQTFNCPDHKSLAPFDGTFGSGDDFCDFGTIDAAGSEMVAASTNLTPFIGTGTVDADIAASGSFIFQAPVDFFLEVLDFGAEGLVRVTYDFDTAVIPLPPAALLGLAGLGIVGYRRHRGQPFTG